MAGKKHFQDFHLLIMDHPGTSEEAISKGPRGNEARLKFALDEILAHTVPGQLILMEAMEKSTLKDYKLFFRWRRKNLKGKFDKTMSDEWREGQNKQWNFYAELAKLAAKEGRIVDNLDSEVTRSRRKLRRFEGAPNKILEGAFELKQEAYLLGTLGRTPNQIARINRRKPTMVIAAGGHGAIFEKEMEPKSIRWYETKDLDWFKTLAQRKKEIIERYYIGLKKLRELRQKRRQKINEELMSRGKLKKMKVRLDKQKRRSPK